MSRSPLRAVAEGDLGWALRVGRSPRGRELRRRFRPIVFFLLVAVLILAGGIAIRVYEPGSYLSVVFIGLAIVFIVACWPAYNRWELSSHVLGAREHSRCAWCAYEMQDLRADPNDGCTVCPECGAAWRFQEEGIERQGGERGEGGA